MSTFADKSGRQGNKTLSSQAADRMRRRRDMAFIKYGSDQKKQNPARLSRTREHAKMIAMKISHDVSSPMSIQSTSTFADFGSAFANFNPPEVRSSATSRRDFFADKEDPFNSRDIDDSFHSASDSSFFGEDGFASSVDQFPSSGTRKTPQRNTTARQYTPSIQEENEFDAFGTTWPSTDYESSITMATMPTNSSMQAKFTHSNVVSTPERSPPQSISESASGGGAAARRRMRRQMRSSSSRPDDSSVESMHTETASQSPMRRPTNAADVSSSARKQTDRVSNYSVQHSHRHSFTSANRSVNSSESGSDANVWDHKQTNGGFTFDAFGLDADQINRQVSDALNDLAGSDHSFLDNSHNGWDSPVPSRSTTPNPSEDGFADIRVNNHHGHAIHVRHSPSSTERSSWTDELEKAENTSINLFKEKAGFHRSPGRQIIRPELSASTSGENEGFRGRLQRQFTAQRASSSKAPSPQYNQTMQMKRSVPSFSMHAVDEAHMTQLRRDSETVSSPRSKQDVEFYDSDERASDVSETMNTEINALSDAGVAPHPFKPSYKVAFDARNTRKDAIPDNLTESTSATTLEEKKDDEHNMRLSGAQASLTEQTEGSGGVRWQDRNYQSQQDSRSHALYTSHDENSRSVQKSIRSPSPPRKTWGNSGQSSHNSPNRRNLDNGGHTVKQDRATSYQQTGGPASYSRSDHYSEPKSKITPASPDPTSKPSWMIERERILASSEKKETDYTRGTDRNEGMTTKSEGGVGARRLHLNAVLNRLSNPSPTDSKSEAGANPTAFLGVQLKMTLSGTASEENVSEVVEQKSVEGTDIKEDVHYKEERKLTYAERRKIEIEQEKQHAARMAEEASISRGNGGKLTYKEKRELELRKQQQDNARQSEGHDAKEKDVAALIKKRIAENRKNLKVEEHDKKTSSVPNYRDLLRPTASNGNESSSSSRVTNDYDPDDKRQSNLIERSPTRFINHRGDDLSPSRVAGVQSQPNDLSPSRIADNEPSFRQASNYTSNQVVPSSSPHRNRNQDAEIPPPRRSNLVIETESSAPRSTEGPKAALSHMLMLQQLQQRDLLNNSAASPTRPIGQPNPRAENGEDQTKSNKAHTPKATMMMLNAFLAGKESVSSPRGGAVSPHEEFPADAQSPVQEPAPSGFPALKDDPKYTRFFKMLKLGMPMDVVKHAMTREGMDPSVMDGDHNKPVGIPLKLDPTYSKYFRMLSIGLPMEAVKHAMARDGLDPAVMDQDHDLPATATKTPTKDTEKDQDSHRRARLHWNPLRKVTRNSLWAKIDQEDNIQIDIDEKEFQELFQAEKTAETAAKTTKQDNGKRSATVRVIDPKRANNGGIILARLKMSHDEMADAVDRIDEYAMDAEQIENMIEYLPTKNERKALETYMLEGGQDAAEKFDGLCECEKFMVSMMTVKHAKRKVRALLFKLQFETFVRDIQKEAFLVEAACDELSNSVRLRQLLGIILEFGNRLNTAGSGNYQKAGAFTIDSLLKLKQAKAFDKKTTFLEYVIRIVNRNNELLLRFEDDIPTVFKADKVSWEQCIGDLEEVENQLENVRRMALYQARHTHAYGLKKKSTKEDDESLSDAEEEFSLEEEVEALKSTQIGLFTLSAIKYISALRDKIEETKHKFSSLLEYFGEDNKNKQPHEIFSTFVKFCRDFNEAKERVFTEEKKKQREERKRQASKTLGPQEGKPPSYTPVQSGNQRNHTPSKQSPPRSSSSMVRASDHQPSVSKAMAYSSARTLEVSPQPPEHYGRSNEYNQPRYTEPKNETRHPQSAMYSNHSHREVSSYQEQEHYSPAESSYETEASPLAYEYESSSPAYPSESPPAIEPSLSQHSNSSSHMAAMRAKARMRRQRNAKR